ncbi:histidine kinase N-terminal 7TM domain-containing protein [Petroclostridium sp. X23]|uniref:histidine kinase N-terminal 7TM domain-containing diguanylate cyclase n=1 Tax=Petroclostridium sp. X23 TaxID=3045146 RepID=UPI0024AE1A30|nr:histidine kinase N-terminal 7TM domain-containing protein [Petroclostridium sp. X23]WHH60373.1 histidine kinase N-terminal 7TM domain-containing protein [Petroclostridium sp. X23]
MNYLVVLMMFLTSLIAVQLAIYIFYNRRKIYLKGFLGLILSVFIYSLFYSFELIAPNLSFMKLFAAIQYIGILSIPAFWVIMALEYTNKSRYLSRKLYIGIFTVPVFLIILNFTNESHHLFYKNYSASIIYSMAIADIKPGIGYITAAVYVNICFVIGNILYVQYFIKGSTLFKKRSFIIVATSLIPFVGYWIYMSGFIPVKIDIVPVFMEVLCLFYTYALFKSNIFETAAIARHIIFDNITEVIIVLDMDNKLIDINKKAEQLFSKKASHIIGQDIYEVFTLFKEIRKYIEGNREVTFDFKIEITQKVYYFKGDITYIDNNGNKGKIIVLSDNTEQVLMIKKLQYYGAMDILTEVYNRNYLYSIANDKILHCVKNNQSLSLIMLDLDRFKNINDTYGHIAGDVVLKNVIATCKSYLGERYIIGRYGGEEFLIILENLEEEKVLEIAEGLRVKIMNLHIVYEDKTIKVTSSFGVFTSKGLTDFDYMVRNVDEALYKAKSAGRNQIGIKKQEL